MVRSVRLLIFQSELAFLLWSVYLENGGNKKAAMSGGQTVKSRLRVGLSKRKDGVYRRLADRLAELNIGGALKRLVSS